ncbi:MAG: phage coat protein [Nitrosomonas sp.]|nr:phage coat protein [Nitrosomonas sp.]MCW5608981.1 phage coat protein [Nitrosomonas sp.]
MSKKAIVLSSAASFSVVPVLAMAEVPASVTASITEAVTDVATIGAAVLGVIIGIYVFKWLRRTF